MMSFFTGSHVNCMMCGTEVEVKHSLSSVDVLDTDLDLRPRGVARLSEKNSVQFCPNCGYSSFSLEKDITYGRRELLQGEEYLEVFHNEELKEDIKKFFLLGIMLDCVDEFQRSASAFLRASWCAEDSGNTAWMIKSKERAIEEFMKSDFTWKNSQVIAIVVDCYRRIGKFDEAIEVINKFGLDNVSDIVIRKVLEFQIALCKNKDTTVHTASQVQV